MELKNQQNCKIKMLFIGEITKPDEAKAFVTRSFGVEIIEEVNGNSYPRTMILQLTGNLDKPQFDKTTMIDGFKVGELVDITFSITGTAKANDKLPKTENNPGQLSGFNNINCSKITRVIPQQQQLPQGYPGYAQPAYQQQPNYVTSPQTGNPVSVGAGAAKPFYPQPAGVVPNDEDGNSMVWNTNTGGWEKLPF